MSLEPFFTSTAVVAVGEIGDKAEPLAIVLAARFRKPWPIIGVWVVLSAFHVV